jgi:flagellar export protein FliJ
MPPFQFRCATLLRLREADRDEKRLHLADALRAQEIVEQRIEEINAEMEAVRARAARGAMPGPVDVDALMETQRYELLLKGERKAAEDQKDRVAAEAQRRREALVAADREVRTLEKLRENQQARHEREQERQNRKQIDDIATQQYVRKETKTWDG